MKGLIVINSYSKSEAVSYKAFRIMSEFSKIGIRMDVVKSVDLPIVYEDGREIIEDIDEWSFCVFLDKDKYLIDAIERKMPVFNDARSTMLCDDKMVTYQSLAGHGIHTPKTIPAPLCYSPNPDEEFRKLFLDKVENELSFPLICKESYGSLGKQVYLIKNRNELDAIEEELMAKPHLYQHFYEEAYGHDFRMITIGGKVVAAMERVNEHDFRSNIAEGGKGKAVKPKQSFVDMAEMVSKILGLDYGGIDIIEDRDGNPVFIEANSNCFFSEVEKVSGVNITKLLVEHIAKRLKESQEVA